MITKAELLLGVELSPRRSAAGSATRPPAEGALAVKAQCELEEWDAVGAAARLLVGLGAHEVAGQRYVRVGDVVGQLIEALGEGIVIGVHPGMSGVGAEELEGQRPQAAAAGHLDRIELRAGDPERRGRLLQWLWHDVAPWGVGVGAGVLAAAFSGHRGASAARG